MTPLAVALAVMVAAPPTLVGRAAPPMLVEKWAVPETAAAPAIAALRGKIVAVLFFQTTCHNCHMSGVPLFQEIEKRFAARGDLATLYVQTAFESLGANTYEMGRRMIADQYKLKGPFGQDRPVPGQHVPATFARFRAGGTPWIVLLDRNGVVVYSDFPDFQKKMLTRVQRLLDGLPIDEPSPSPTPAR